MRRPLALTLAACLVIGPVLSGAVVYLALRRELERRLAFRPPIAVLDYRKLAQALAQGVAAGELEPAFAELKERGRRLRERGYLVLNRASVDAVPDAHLVPTGDVTLPQPRPPVPVAAPAAAPGPATIAPEEAAGILRGLLEPPAATDEPP